MAGQRDLAAGIAALGDMVLDQRDQAVDRLTPKAQRFEIGLGQWKICDSLGADGGDDIHDAGSSCGDHIMVRWHVDDLRIRHIVFPENLATMRAMLTRLLDRIDFPSSPFQRPRG